MNKALALTTLALALVPASAQAAEETFKVSLYGIQRFDKIDHEVGNPKADCFGSRGDIEERTTVKFHTTKPVKFHVSSSSGGSLSVYAPSGDQLPLRVESAVAHSGSYIKEERSCQNGQFGWILDPPPIAVNCSATVSNRGFALQGGQGGRLEASGAEFESLAKSPFYGCPYGDLSGSMYKAKGRIKPSLLLEGRETEVVLRGKDKSRYDSEDGSFTETKTRTTVYVTFKKVGK